ncbi:MAG: acyl-CoA dehydrogenase family protein [Alphaproteobacteria bacterium]|nr:acyl-CoA dehydrogenase family protein [Alphaproteobacteria bacterium]
MADRSFLAWPFFEDRHRALVPALDAWAARSLAGLPHDDVDAACRALVRRLGADGWLQHAAGGRFDVRTLCLIRETLARHDGLADFAFAMQGLGTGSIALFGSDAQRARYLPPVARGEAIAAFAMSEPEGGSDVAALRTTARRDGDGYVLDGTKTWISNGGIADHYVVFARTDDAPGARGLSAFVVDAASPGLSIAERIPVIAPHPLATLRFTRCTVPASALLGKQGDGFKIAMGTLDVFRATVGAAALGFARRALDEALARIHAREAFGQKLKDFQLTQAKIAEMATAIDAAALLVYRAAWAKDSGAPRVTREASMAKMQATETAQQVIDHAVQLWGGMGVVAGNRVEALYREIRALRIYEGTTEIQKLVIAAQVMQAWAEAKP